MSLTCNGQLKIRCNKCGHLNSINCKDLDFEDVESEVKSGGTETHHQATYNFPCANCKTEIEVTYDVWEYPQGQKSLDNIEVKNGTVIQSCTIQIQSD